MRLYVCSIFKVISIGHGDYGCVHDADVIPEERWRHYNFVMVMLQYVLPLSAVTFTYGHMAKVSNECNAIARQGNGPNSPAATNATDKRTEVKFDLRSEDYCITCG